MMSLVAVMTVAFFAASFLEQEVAGNSPMAGELNCELFPTNGNLTGGLIDLDAIPFDKKKEVLKTLLACVRDPSKYVDINGIYFRAKERYGQVYTMTGLMAATLLKFNHDVGNFIRLKADLNVVNTKGMTAATLAAWKGNDNMLRFLLNKGVKVNRSDRWGNTALFWAAKGSGLETAVTLLNHGADVNVRNNYNQTSLMHAALFGQASMVQLLLDHGASTKPYDNWGQTAESFARKRLHNMINILNGKKTFHL